MSNALEKAKAEVTIAGVLDVQVCVDRDWSDAQAKEFTEGEYPCGTESGWSVAEHVEQRVKCAMREGFVHMLFQA